MRFILFFLALALAGCSGSLPAEGNLAPQYAAAPEGEFLTTNLLPSFQTGTHDLDWLLVEFDYAVERGAWRRLVYTFDPDIYAEQFVFMKRDGGDRSDAQIVAQILEETIGLGMVGNNLRPPGGRDAANPFAGLDRIQSIEWTAVDPPGSEFRQVDGLVLLDDGTYRSLSFTVFQTDDGQWRVVVPQG